MSDARALVLATRPSPLARAQTELVRAALAQAFPGVPLTVRVIVTRGDRVLDRPLPEIGGKGLFTLELEQALRAGQADLAVHSLKDLPIEDASGLRLGALLERADPRDVLIAPGADGLQDLPPGARVGTSSLRRAAQLLAARPDLQPQPVRGNVETRLRKVEQGECDAALLAAAGLLRLGLHDRIAAWLPLEVMLPAPGQGALAVQCRADDRRALELLAPLDHAPTRAAVEAERAFLAALGGGCSAPVGACAVNEGAGLWLRGVAAAADGQSLVRVEGRGQEPGALGRALAARALAQGAAAAVTHA